MAALASVPAMMIAFAKALRDVKKILREEVQETHRKLDDAVQQTNEKLDNATSKLETAEAKREEVRAEVNQKLDENLNATQQYILINDRIDRHRINNEAMLKVLQSEVDAMRLELKNLHQPNPMPPASDKS